MNRKTEVLLSRTTIAARVNELAAEINRDYAGKSLLLVAVLKGAVVFLSDLMRHLHVPVEVDFIAVSSYGHSTVSSGVVRIMKDLDRGIDEKHVLVVEDIIDTGLTLNYLRENLQQRHPASLKVVVLLDKPERRKVVLNPDYCGFIIPDYFVVGYGLDYGEQYRHLPDLCLLS